MATDAEVGHSLRALALNAQRLLNDAEIVFAQGSHQTAASLSILAIEEVGKFFQVKWQFSDNNNQDSKQRVIPPKGRRSHRLKQATVGSFYTAEVAIGAIKEFLRKIGYPDDDKTVSDFANALHQEEDSAKKALARVVDFVAEKMATAEKSQFMRDAQMGAIDDLKQRGFYVDLDANGKILNDPSNLPRSDCDLWLERARHAVVRLPDDA
jgi:AbiV family abortive infection protein